jgi:hypothetical protein
MFGCLAMGFLKAIQMFVDGGVFGDKHSYLSMLGIINPNKNNIVCGEL